jgi:uncharacterized repeat protein (TIGR03843 family)
VTPAESLLLDGELTVEGRVVSASNLTLYARVDGPAGSTACVYKPVSGERPLWDFPDGTLAGREVAAYQVARLAGLDLVPPTVLRDGPLGPGMCQVWVVTDDDRPLVDVRPVGARQDGWLSVVRGEDGSGRPVELVHRDDPALRAMALLDAVLNNADRKGGHVLRQPDGTVVGVDHGLCFHVEPKLRTVLWGWVDEPLLPHEQQMLHGLAETLPDAGLEQWLSPLEAGATQRRVERVLARGRLPRPSRSWPSIPWPAF